MPEYRETATQDGIYFRSVVIEAGRGKDRIEYPGVVTDEGYRALVAAWGAQRAIYEGIAPGVKVGEKRAQYGLTSGASGIGARGRARVERVKRPSAWRGYYAPAQDVKRIVGGILVNLGKELGRVPVLTEYPAIWPRTIRIRPL